MQYYCVGFFWYDRDVSNQLPRFKQEGIWENGFDDKYINKVKSIPVGSKLAAKTSYTRKENGKTISVLQVHAIGTVIGNPGDGKQLRVDWQKDFKPFVIDGRGAYRSTISQVNQQENIDLIFGNRVKTEIDALAFDEKDRQDDFPHNQILFGPPGTGKTYNTINKAVSIIDNLKETALPIYYPEREDLRERFQEELIDDWDNPNGQIAFITFHQSMSYEDFIEGIKPGVNNNNKVIYDIEPGIFKRISALAKDNWLDANKGNKEELSFEEAFSRLRDEWQDNQDMKFPLRSPGYDYTILDFTKTSIKFKKASGGTGHTLSISTLRDYFYKIREVRSTGVGIYYPALLDKLRSYQPSAVLEKELKNYVLIIDEINRGNVSQIFGELITLIEENKRFEKPEALELSLAYSKEKFSVPPNLYIIGTMNTADRSVEALDAALRRRFTFQEMPSRYQLPELDYDFLGIKGRALLETINKRIEKLIDKDHLIGHSYLMEDKSVSTEEKLIEALYCHIIPLLQEYFFGDYGKIGLVLGKGFVRQKEWDKNTDSFADFDPESAIDYAEKPVYEIIDYRNDPVNYKIEINKKEIEMNFEKAIKLLMKQPIE